MSGKSDPRALLRSWQLREDFEVVVHEEVKPGARQRSKKYGRAQDMHMTETGRVGNKTDQVLLLVSTTSQDADALPFALQVAKLNYSTLRRDLLADVKKGLDEKPSLGQLASKPCSIVSASVVSFCVSCLQEKSSLCTRNGSRPMMLMRPWSRRTLWTRPRVRV